VAERVGFNGLVFKYWGLRRIWGVTQLGGFDGNNVGAEAGANRNTLTASGGKPARTAAIT